LRKLTIKQKIGRGLLLVLFLPFLPLVILLAIVSISAFLLHRLSLYLLIWFLWLPRGKDVLFVSSDSPVWHQYMNDQVLPFVRKRAVVLNWSERKGWSRWSFSAHVFRTFGGSRGFNPLIVIFRPLHLAQCFRFFYAFRDCKHGNTVPIEQMRRRLMSCL